MEGEDSNNPRNDHTIDPDTYPVTVLPNYRRKSSYFARRSVANELMPAPKVSSPVVESRFEAMSEIELCQSKKDILIRYIEKTEEEISTWKRVCRELREKCNASKMYSMSPHLTWSDCAGDLSADDIVFLNARPNYSKIAARLDHVAEKTRVVVCGVHDCVTQMRDDVKRASEITRSAKKLIAEHLYNELSYPNHDSGNWSDENIEDMSIDTEQDFATVV